MPLSLGLIKISARRASLSVSEPCGKKPLESLRWSLEDNIKDS